MANSNSQRSPSNGRPSKRVRVATPTERSRSRSPPRRTALTESTPRTRGPTACERCRSRKTRCDNHRPCGYCAKHQVPCVYDDNDANSTPSVTGEQILEAIGNLSELVRSQGHRNAPSRRHSDRNWPLDSHTPQDTIRVAASPYTIRDRDLHDDDVATEPDERRSTRLPPLHSQGTESLLRWEPLSSFQPSLSTFGASQDDQSYSSQIPNIDYRELTRLESKYIVGVHLKNPILDLGDLHRKILQISENGLDWSTRTCLVTLVCAIGALTQRYQDPDNVCITTPSPGITRSSIGCESELELAMQFWGIAARRLGFAIAQNHVEAVQCLCLAGIWYMHRLNPLQAWKYFNLAGAAWHALNMLDDSTRGWLYQESETSFTIMQSLYFTIWKSECEIKVAIDVPGPILDNVDFPHAFPLPPNMNDQVLSPGHAEAERCWYYYLAEIAARHMLNRVLRTHNWKSEVPSEREIRKMVAQADELEAQTQQWHSSLPPMFSFEIPAGYSMPVPADEQTNILRHRYLNCRDLIGRPFVKLCVEQPLQIDPSLRWRVASYASQSLRFGMLKLDQATPQLHQGSWFVLQNVTLTTLVIGAIMIARKRPWLLGAQTLPVPQGWQDKIMQVTEHLEPFWEYSNGGAPVMRRLIQAVLDECGEE